jgi:hypothetical protein
MPDIWNEHNPQSDTSKWHPSAGYYNGSDPKVVARQISDMQYANLQAGIASWWGPGTREDKRMPLLLSEAEKVGFHWAAYYEQEGFTDPSPEKLTADLSHIRNSYASSKAFLHINGKAVIFAYGGGNDSCGMVDRWAKADTSGFYIVLKVFGGYRDCANQPDGWHQYAPGGNLDIQQGYSAVTSPGFWRNKDAAPLLARDVARFRRDVTTVATSKLPFQLITTYNEWPEGTPVESATEWATASGRGAYLDVLHEVFGANPR